MQTINIHNVDSVSISPMQEHNTSRWVTIAINYDSNRLEINLFLTKDLPTKDLSIILKETPK